MGQKLKIRRRAVVITSFTLAAFAVLGAFYMLLLTKTREYRRELSRVYLRAFSELTAEVTQIDESLSRLIASGSPSSSVEPAAVLYGSAYAARRALAELPLPAGELEATAELLSAVTAHAVLLSSHAASGEPAAEKDTAYTASLSKIVSRLSGELTALLADISFETITPESMHRLITGGGDFILQLRRIDASVGNVTLSAPNKPAVTARLLEDKALISRAEAASAASGVLGVRRNTLKYDGIRETPVPVYMFSSVGDGGNVYVEVTRAGGYVLSAFSSRKPMSENVSETEAQKLAERFLRENAYRNMTAIESRTEGSTVLVTFAYKDGAVLCYPDKISVRIARDNGKVTGLESLEYIMNHHKRDLTSPELSPEAAGERLSARLTVKSHALAVIQRRGGGEILCHEFKCKSESGDVRTVYLNAETGTEELIL